MIPKIVRPGLSILLLALLSGCNTVTMNAAGDIARQQADLIKVSVWLMLIIIIPVMILTVVFAWKYRQGANARYEPDWDHSTKLELVIWGAPLLIIIALGLITWISTHKLDPYRPLDRIDETRPMPAGAKVLEVQVVSLDWKWLFIYPEQGIATVNELVTPVDTPIRFKLTSSTVMNAFYIPTLAGMIYTMPGMETTLNAVVNKPGDYKGMSSNFSGDGFSHMKFAYRGTTAADFDAWVQKVKASGNTLGRADYLALEKPSEKEPVRYYGTVQSALFNAVVNRCVAEGTTCANHQMALDMQRVRNDIALKQLPKDAKRQVAKADGEVCETPTNSVKK
ncbi:ubiquinol oxidase subunit II [Massilia sp. Dwa41.01b]|uniref:ubiquinol oxidase subunit II n=1 Tax=unclassified Massilia TaxID=2609279 RepID=UPI0015FF2672|nr:MULTISPECIES: ubiquinol oxidase subunit II [unclassified Massilia]QNA89123.1 ubiquinol oxidase subunit II [Massilia sp. Dwa41.01b]QNB00016.1 ubiquinol oxidase subunit II [Massilia sp. Se16.2.3]